MSHHMRAWTSRGAGRRGAIALALASVAWGVPARATTVAPMDLASLSRHADAVVVARCTALGPAVDALTHRPGTVSAFAVDEIVKGAGVGGELRVALPGGAIGRQATLVAGVPRFELGKAVVLFLTAPRADGARGVLGMSQGAFEVTDGPHGARVRSAGGHERDGEASAAQVGTRPLADFLAEVRGYLR